MKRAEVCKVEGDWSVFEAIQGPLYHRHPIGKRDAGYEHPESPFATHAEALRAALAAVGLAVPAEVLATPPEHREAP